MSKTVRYYSPKRRAVYARGDEIDSLTLFNLYGWICWICKESINPRYRLPHVEAATVEHIIPLCQGGTHTWDNCAPAHARCNFAKGGQVWTRQMVGGSATVVPLAGVDPA